MITFLFILSAFLDFQRPDKPKEGIETQFVTTQLVEESLTGCTMNGQSGTLNNDPLAVNWIRSPEPATENATTWIPGTQLGTPIDSAMISMVMVMVPVNPGGGPNPNPSPDPNPPSPPVSATPEPSTVAILGITASVLIFLLFGRQYGRRLTRRI